MFADSATNRPRERANGISTSLKQYAGQPSAYRVFVLFGPPQCDRSGIAKNVAQQLSGLYIDLLKDKLHTLTPKLGLYSPSDLKKDMGSWSRETNSLLVIDEIEPLLDTWSRQQQEDLFKLLSRWRPESIVLLATRLNLPFEEFLGKDRVFRLG